MSDHPRIFTGSHPYDDGSGFQFSIKIYDDGDAPTVWLEGGAGPVMIDIHDWKALKNDIDSAIVAYVNLPNAKEITPKPDHSP